MSHLSMKLCKTKEICASFAVDCKLQKLWPQCVRCAYLLIPLHLITQALSHVITSLI